MTEKKFTPGARVARFYKIQSVDVCEEAVVKKVYKNGKVLVNGDSYSPEKMDGRGILWARRRQYLGYSHVYTEKSIALWDDASDGIIKTGIERRKRFERWDGISRRVREMMPYSYAISDGLMCAFEDLLNRAALQSTKNQADDAIADLDEWLKNGIDSEPTGDKETPA